MLEIKNAKNNKNEKIITENSSNETSISGDERKRKAFLDLLLEQHLQDPKSFTELDIRQEVDTFMFEGHDTTTMSIMFTLAYLGCYPQYQERVQAEIDEICERYDLDNESLNFQTSHLREMKFLEACIKESLRLMPSVPMIGRETVEEMEIDGYAIPKGTTMVIFIAELQRDKDFFPEPDKFIPDRFYEKSEHFIRNPYAFVPFSAGPRNCIGQKFALQEEKIVLAHVLKMFKLRSVKSVELLSVYPELVLRPQEPILVEFQKRTQQFHKF